MRGVLAVVAVSVMVGCSAESATQPTLRSFQGLSLTPRVANVAIGETLQLVANPLDANGAPLTNLPAATFTSSDSTVATVGADGVVTGAGVGLAEITAKVADDNLAYTAVSPVSVNTAPITLGTFVVTPDTLTVATGSFVSFSGSATDTSGAPVAICDQAARLTQNCVAAAFRSTDLTKAGQQFKNSFLAISPGTTQIIAEVASGGVTVVDTAMMAVTYPTAVEMDASFDSNFGFFFFPGSVVLAAGGTVTFCNFTLPPKAFDITFADPSAVPDGNVPAFDTGCFDRTFPTSGTYPFTSTTNGVTGTVVVK